MYTSGANDADYLQKAQKEYQVEYTVLFTLLHCLDMLKMYDKWNWQLRKIELELKAAEVEIHRMDQRHKDEELYLSTNDEELKAVGKNLEAWNSFPWGEHLWCHLYDEIKNLKQRHIDEHYYGLKKYHNYVPRYTLSGFVFAFQ
ncbi:hypothetical protein Tco_1008362, partial [Tanacetum coccineum]